jgi:hypothetical protein
MDLLKSLRLTADAGSVIDGWIQEIITTAARRPEKRTRSVTLLYLNSEVLTGLWPR